MSVIRNKGPVIRNAVKDLLRFRSFAKAQDDKMGVIRNKVSVIRNKVPVILSVVNVMKLRKSARNNAISC